jgi:hypothetical protein
MVSKRLLSWFFGAFFKLTPYPLKHRPIPAKAQINVGVLPMPEISKATFWVTASHFLDSPSGQIEIGVIGASPRMHT